MMMYIALHYVLFYYAMGYVVLHHSMRCYLVFTYSVMISLVFCSFTRQTEAESTDHVDLTGLFTVALLGSYVEVIVSR